MPNFHTPVEKVLAIHQRPLFDPLESTSDRTTSTSIALAGSENATPATLTYYDPFLDAPGTAPLPAAVTGVTPETPTPSREDIELQLYAPPPDLDLLSSVPAGPLTSPAAKAGHNLKLPSFEMLGIAAPHPDRIGSTPHDQAALIGAGPLSKPEDPLHLTSPELSRPRLPPFASHSRVTPDDSTGSDSSHDPSRELALPKASSPFTPPDDSKIIDWGSFAGVRTAAPGIEAQPSTSADVSVGTEAGVENSAAESDSVDPVVPELTIWPFLQDAVEALLQNMTYEIRPSSSVKVLSHALPCPSATGHAFPAIINAIHERIPPASTVWINVFHAVPGRFNIEDLPMSPPSTPGPAIGGEDYFTTKVFDSAVPVTDYQGEAALSPPFKYPPSRSPNPIVPPATIDFSIVERYIPPTSANEFADIFSFTKRSLLLDRLVELSPNNGSLLFVYPTKVGGQTFKKEYLGPIIDPLLRTTTIINDLPPNFGAALGHMPAAETLSYYDEFRARLSAYCNDLSSEGSILERYHPERVDIELIYAAKADVALNKDVWTKEWWAKQEKTRIREAVTSHFQRARHLHSMSEAMPTQLMHHIMDEVSARPYATPPKHGVQVGIFVLKKSTRKT